MNGGMPFISKKSVHIQVGQLVPDIREKLGNDIIPTSTSLCYLDIELDPSLKWDTHNGKVVGKAYHALGLLKPGLKFAPVKTNSLAFKTIVLPILEYATEVRSPYHVSLQ